MAVSKQKAVMEINLAKIYQQISDLGEGTHNCGWLNGWISITKKRDGCLAWLPSMPKESIRDKIKRHLWSF